MSNWSTPRELTPDEREVIVTELQNLESKSVGCWGIRSFPLRLPGRPPLFVKHHCDKDAFAEADTQHFFYLLAKKDNLAPRIPRVVDAFSNGKGDYFLVMENVDAPTLDSCGMPEARAVQLAAFAVKWLQDQLSSVPEAVFGRISSEKAPVWHRFFPDHEAPGAFADANELAKYTSKASQRCRLDKNRLSDDEVLASFGDHRRICHSDIKMDNFLLNAEGVWIIDFQHISVLPEVFQSFAFFNCGEPFASKVGRALGYQPSSKANLLGPIATVLVQSGGISLRRVD